MFRATRSFHTLFAHTLLFGKSSLSDEDNFNFFIAVQNFIKNFGRFTLDIWCQWVQYCIGKCILCAMYIPRWWVEEWYKTLHFSLVLPLLFYFEANCFYYLSFKTHFTVYVFYIETGRGRNLFVLFHLSRFMWTLYIEKEQ